MKYRRTRRQLKRWKTLGRILGSHLECAWKTHRPDDDWFEFYDWWGMEHKFWVYEDPKDDTVWVERSSLFYEVPSTTADRLRDYFAMIKGW